MKKPELPSYSALNTELNDMEQEVQLSQIHGIFCGLLAGQKDKPLDWQQTLSAINKGIGQHKNQLQPLYELMQQQLKEFLFEFELFLPEDEQALAERAEALTLWCQGLLTGLKLAGVNIEKQDDPEVAEVVQDLVEIAKINYEEVVDTEEDEEAYLELVEYVRMSAILIYQTLQHPEKTESSKASKLH